MGSTRKVTYVLCGGLGVACVVAGIVLIHIFSDMIHTQIKDGIRLTNGSSAFKRWQRPSTPIYFQAWMFDVVNYLEVLRGEKPMLVQRGPYTYRGERKRFDIDFTGNGTVRYKVKRTFYFQRNMSIGSEDDVVHTVNLPLLTITSLTRNEEPSFKKAVNALLEATGEHPFLNVSVHGLLWGYEDSLLKAIKTIAQDMHVKLNISDFFGLFKNGTDDGLYEIFTGEDSIYNFGEIASWDGLQHLDFWTHDDANMINGTDGTMYPPFIDISSVKYLFSSDLCRSIGLVHSKSVQILGINLEKFVAHTDLLNNTVNNQSFCTPAGHCPPSGLLNITVCKKGAPVIMSMPHFLGCDKNITNAVQGLNPQLEEHKSFIDIEPMTGISMNVGKKLQVNTYIDYIEGYSFTERWKTPIFFPMIWMNQSASVSESSANSFKDEVLLKITFTEAVEYCLLALGSFILICVLAGIIKRKICSDDPPNKEDHTHLVNAESETTDDSWLKEDHRK